MQEALNHAFSLAAGTDNSTVKQAELQLGKLRSQVNYPLCLLNYMQHNQHQGQLRAAIQLRIWCDSYKNMEQFQRNTYQPIMNEIKNSIVTSYLNYNLQISKTLRPGIVALTVVQFPDNWEGLVLGLISQSTKNPGYILPTLKLVRDFTQKYSYLSRSDPLYKQIIMVCNQIHDFLLKLAVDIFPNCQRNDQSSLKILQVLMRVFYNLNYQDLHPSFQNHLKQWMDLLKGIMQLQHRSAEDEVFKCKGAALESILLYASKYKQDVQQDIKNFSSDIWELCSKAGEDPENDEVVLSCLKYFKSLIMWPDMKDFFSSNLEAMVGNLIIPNISPNNSTNDQFLQENQTYIDFNFRNAQISTRKSSAVQLLRTICRYYKNFEQYLVNKLQQYIKGEKNPQNNMMMMTMLIEGGSKAFRDIDGCTQLFINENLIQIGYSHIAKPSLIEIANFIRDNPEQPIQNKQYPLYIASLLRYVFYYRIYLPKEELTFILQLCSGIHTNCVPLSNVVFITVAGFLSLRHGDFTHYKDFVTFFNGQNLQPLAVGIFKMIYKYDQKSLHLNAMLTKILEVMTKTLGRSAVNYYQYYQALIQSMLKKTFQYDFKSALNLFQSIGHLSYELLTVRSDNADKLQKIVLNYFQQTLKNQSDLLNFCLQLMAIFLQYNPEGKMNNYVTIYESILAPQNWREENLSVLSSYIKYISSFVKRDKLRLISDKEKFGTILTKLIQLQRYQLFYRLMDSILKVTDLKGFYDSGYLGITLQGTAIIAGKSVQVLKTAMVFVLKMTYQYNTQEAIQYMNQIEPDAYTKLLLVKPDIIQTMQTRRDRKLMFGSICKAICTGCISSTEVIGQMLNLLIDNTTCRFSKKMITEMIQTNRANDKKEVAYQRLTVFNRIQTKEQDIDIDQEICLLKTYEILRQNNSPALGMIGQQNQQRLKRMHDKNQPKIN